MSAERSKKAASFSFILTAVSSLIAFCCWASKGEGDYAAAFVFQIISVLLGVAGAVLANRLKVPSVKPKVVEQV